MDNRQQCIEAVLITAVKAFDLTVNIMMKGTLLTVSSAYTCSAFSININLLEMNPSYEILI
jgi:hypothetical protein